MTRLPHDLEPKIVYNSRDPATSDGYYIAKWREYLGDGNFKYRSKVCSIDKHGKLAAYSIAKRALLEEHKDVIDILMFMSRLNNIDLK